MRLWPMPRRILVTKIYKEEASVQPFQKQTVNNKMDLIRLTLKKVAPAALVLLVRLPLDWRSLNNAGSCHRPLNFLVLFSPEVNNHLTIISYSCGLGCLCSKHALQIAVVRTDKAVVQDKQPGAFAKELIYDGQSFRYQKQAGVWKWNQNISHK